MPFDKGPPLRPPLGHLAPGGSPSHPPEPTAPTEPPRTRSWFSGKSSEPPNSQPKPSEEEELSRDTVASVLRTLAEFALPTNAVSRDEFAKRCEELAKAVLVKSEVDPETGSPRKPEKIYREVKNHVREQRRAESKEYANHRESANIIVSDLVSNLKKSLAQREDHDREIVGLLEDMENVVETGDLRQIKRVASRAANGIKDMIATQRDSDRRQLNALSDQLRDMRAELNAARAQMQRDPLTELHNRGAFDEAFEKTVELALASAMDLSLFMMDLDHFKLVNDTYGHQAGDFVLKAVSKQIIRCFPRKEDLVVRYGGEEFAALCRNTGEEDAFMLADRVRKAVEQLEIRFDDILIKQTVSVGYAVLKPGDRPEKFLKRADKALYAAKRLGRNRVEPRK